MKVKSGSGLPPQMDRTSKWDRRQSVPSCPLLSGLSGEHVGVQSLERCSDSMVSAKRILWTFWSHAVFSSGGLPVPQLWNDLHVPPTGLYSEKNCFLLPLITHMKLPAILLSEAVRCEERSIPYGNALWVRCSAVGKTIKAWELREESISSTVWSVPITGQAFAMPLDRCCADPFITALSSLLCSRCSSIEHLFHHRLSKQRRCHLEAWINELNKAFIIDRAIVTECVPLRSLRIVN